MMPMWFLTRCCSSWSSRRFASSAALRLCALCNRVDHRPQDGGVGAQELGVLLGEVARLAAVHLEQAVGLPAGQEDRHVHQRHGPVLLQEVGELEAVLLGDVPRDDGAAGLDRVGLGRPLAHRQAHLPDDAGPPADPGPHEQAPPVRLDLHDLGKVRPERLADEAAGFGQHLVQVLAAQGEVAELGEDLLPQHHLLAIGHAAPPGSRSGRPHIASLGMVLIVTRVRSHRHGLLGRGLPAVDGDSPDGTLGADGAGWGWEPLGLREFKGRTTPVAAFRLVATTP